MKKPVVSVKMVTFNHAPFIEQAIEGVLAQKTIYPFELVIGEDCSTDGTRQIVFAYAKKYPHIIRVVSSEKNVGMRKNGLRTALACQGKYLAFCEGDDYWHNPEKLQKQVDYLEHHGECGLVYSSYDVYHVRTGKRIRDFIKHRNWSMPENVSIADFAGDKNEIGYGILTCTVMVRNDLYKKIIASDPYLHQSDYFLMGDTQLWAELSTVSRLHYIPESLATHTITLESATRSRDIRKTLRFTLSQAELMLYLCEKYKFPASTRAIFEKSWCDTSLRLAFHTKNAELAEEVRKRKRTFNGKDWVFYYGARNPLIHYPLRAAAVFRYLISRNDAEWI